MSNDPNKQAEAQAVISMMKELTDPLLITEPDLETGAIMALPVGIQLHDLKPFQDKRRDRPERIKGTSQHTTLDSFIAHVLRFKDAQTAIFALDDPKCPALLAVYDYHEGNREVRVDEEGNVKADASFALADTRMPRFGVHRASYLFPLSEEWQAWQAASAMAFTQEQFALFLEDHLLDVIEPSAAFTSVRDVAQQLGFDLAGPATLLGLSRGLSLRVDQKVTNAQNLSSGEATIAFEESHSTKDGGPLKVPGGFAIAIPVFRGGARYQVSVRLRYRHAGGRITWLLKPHRLELVFKDAFEQAVAAAEQRTELPMFFGTPEN